MLVRTLAAAALAVVLAATPALAQAAPAAPRSPAPAASSATASSPPSARSAAPPASPTAIGDSDARETREDLNRLFDSLPPTLRRVLQFDPSLLNNADYLAAYPALADFLVRHPEVARNPSFFIGQPDQERPTSDAVRIWNDFSQAATIVVIFTLVAGALMWLLKTVIEYRRWLRVSRLNADIQVKLIDRFTTSEDLLAYIQTPPGRRLIDVLPAAPEQPAAIAAPIGRILWSIQAGLVLAAAGVGFLVVSGRTGVELAPLVSSLGVLGIALGAGFVLSAAAAWLLSRRLGLLRQPRNSGDDADAPGFPA